MRSADLLCAKENKIVPPAKDNNPLRIPSAPSSIRQQPATKQKIPHNRKVNGDKRPYSRLRESENNKQKPNAPKGNPNPNIRLIYKPELSEKKINIPIIINIPKNSRPKIIRDDLLN